MINAASLLKIRDAPCFGHTLNLIVTDWYKLEYFDQVIKKCKAIFFRSSMLAADKLRALQLQNNKKQLKPIQDVCITWNSTYEMLKRTIEIRTELVYHSWRIHCNFGTFWCCDEGDKRWTICNYITGHST